ncbi:fibroleukin-like [Ylistrum balloti]|uniref:fibroleukin-like n=1 Tax=Ylistrum balloti TaxID=509963 RepID=UPI002905DEFC|nr:fibroleukin-like [Ylistrum balloti]
MYMYCVNCFVTPSKYFHVGNGNVNEATLLTTSSSSHALLYCAKECEDPRCMSFRYSADTKLCSIFSSVLSVSSGSINTDDKYFQKASGVINCAPINVYGKLAKCNRFNSESWTIVQRRYDGTLTFDKTWNEFKAGFGDLDGEYWIGNEALHLLTQGSKQIAMFVLEDWNGVEKYAQYDNFYISSETDKYRLTVSGYSGTAGDCLSFHNGYQFSTKDSDNDVLSGNSCSREYDETGFWFHQCHACNINGVYVTDNGAEETHALIWRTFSERYQPMKKSRVMLRSAL